jgi:hypothetical protein
LEKKGELEKNRDGQSHIRRRSLDLSLKTGQQTPLQQPFFQEKN